MNHKLRNLGLLIIFGAFLCVPKITFAAEWVNVGFADNNIKTVLVDSKNNQHIIVSLASYIDNNYNFYTEDGGNTWQPVNMGGAMTPCNNFIINPKSTNEVWAGCSVGLFRSVDGGKNFTVIDKYRTTQGVNVSVTADGVVYMASIGNNLHKSIDGIFWEALSAPGGSSQPVVFLNKYTPSEIYVSAANSGLYKSSDAGYTWVLANSQAQIRSGVGQMTFDAAGKICASVSMSGIGCSTDGGFTWSSFVSPNLAKPVEYQHFYHLVQNPDDDANILVLAGTWSGLDMKIYNYKSGVAIPEVTALSQSVSGISVSQGVVFTWAPHSAWTKGLWRNDGIAVMPEYLKKHPVIIVPGMLGSWFAPKTGEWKLDPVLKTYDDLYFSFVNAGYEPDKDLFVFPYQWRNDNKYTAGLLSAKIKEAKSKSGSDKVDIIAHSMGGLVTRFYAESDISDIYDNDINQIFFLGVPQLGSVKDYPIWSNGYVGFEDIYFGMFLTFLLNEEAATNGYYGTGAVKEYIDNNVPSIKQLLPVYSYLNSSVYPSGHPINRELAILNSNSKILEERNIKIINIIGNTGTKTIGKFTVDDTSSQPVWEFGSPIGLNTGNIYDGVGFVSGDGTVSLESQSFIKGENYILSNVKHADIPKNVTKTLFQILGVNSMPLITDSVNKLLMIKAYSPVDFYVTAPNSKKIGFNKDGTDFSEIEGAFYAGNESDTEFLTIPNPLPGEYKVVAYGTATGSYEIEATYADDEVNTLITSSYIGQATPGKEDTLLVGLSPDTGTIETTIDDKVAPVTTANVEGNLVNGFYNSDAIITLSSIDTESGVKKAEYSLDGIIWQDYTSPIVLNQDGGTDINYRSVDWVGNVENVQTLVLKIDKSAPLVSIDLNKETYTHWDTLDMSCEASDSFSGVQEFVVSLDGVVVDCTEPRGLFDQALGIHKIEYRAIDNAGNVTSGERVYSLIASFSSTLRDIAWLYENKHFKNRGNAISIAVHVELSWLFDIIGNNRKSKASLEQAQSLLDKQISKSKVTKYGYDMISKDIKFILEGE